VPDADPDRGAERERDRISRVYGEYHEGGRRARWDDAQPGNRAMLAERDDVLRSLLRSVGPQAPTTVLDVGCGNGDALARFVAGPALGGHQPHRAIGVDLLRERLGAARDAYGPKVATADATALPFADGSIDLVLCFTVLSSVSVDAVRRAIAADITRVLAPGGAVAWYDMRRPSPGNREVSPIGELALRALFPGLDGPARTLTLLPPLARRLGRRTDRLYPAFARVPALRTHLAAVLAKP